MESSNFQSQITPPPPPFNAAVETSSFADVDEAYLNGVYAGLSFRSLLTYGAPPPVTYSSSDLIKTPKSEPLFDVSDYTPPYNFFPDAAPPSFHQRYTSENVAPYNFFSEATKTSPFLNQQLPDLISLENADRVETPSYARRKQRQQQRLSDKTRCLQKLLPVDKKMDMATVLEEAYKYIKFLQAQVSVLQSLPMICDQSRVFPSGGGGGELGKLNRQEVLQVVVNSPVVQTQLYSKGCCVYSIEQLFLLKNHVNGEMTHAFHPYGV